MPVGQPTPTVARYTCTILTCDPTTSPPIIEAALKGADARPITIVALPGAFRWPEVGETWVVRQENNSWYLDGRALNPSDALPVSALASGQMRLDATTVRDANGLYMVGATNQGVANQTLHVDPGTGSPTWAAPIGSTTVARAQRSTSLSITANTYTKVPFDDITFDPAGCFSLVTSRYTAPSTGYYQVNTSILFAVSATGTYTESVAFVYKNGVAALEAVSNAAVENYVGNTISDIMALNATDYLELYAYNSQTCSLTGSAVWNYLSVVRVA